MFLVHIIYGYEVKMDISKLDTMCKRPIPVKRRKVQAFCGIANYYHQLIVNYSTKACSLIDLTNYLSFKWGDVQEQGFDKNGALFVSAPFVKQFDTNLVTRITMQTSIHTMAGMLSQYLLSNGCKHFLAVASYIKRISTIQRNLQIHDIELFTVVDCLSK